MTALDEVGGASLSDITFVFSRLILVARKPRAATFKARAPRMLKACQLPGEGRRKEGSRLVARQPEKEQVKRQVSTIEEGPRTFQAVLLCPLRRSWDNFTTGAIN